MSMISRIILSIIIVSLLACKETSSAEGLADTGKSQLETSNNGAQDEVTDSISAGQAEDSTDSKMERVEKSIIEMQQQMGIDVFIEPWTGDLDAMIEQRMIRVLTVYNPGRYYIDKGQEKGLTYDWFKLFETYVNEQLGRNHIKVYVVFVPLARDELIPALLGGRGDIVAAGLTITPNREEVVRFSNPATRELSEILVTGPSAPEIQSIEDLAGKEIYVRASSSYRASLDELNKRFVEQGLEPVIIQDALEYLEDIDILEMVNAGLIPWAVVDDYKTQVWAVVLEDLVARDDIVFRSGGRLGYAMRPDSPELAAMLNEFLKTHKQGTLKGNILINRYLKNLDWAEDALDETAYQRFEALVDVFDKYGAQYGIDYLMVAAQGYQESRLDQNARSHAGAIGIMQLLPSTAADKNVGIPDITEAESNIHAGIKYLNFIRNRYFSDEGIDAFNQTLFAFASYNAGPARVRSLRKKAAEQGYDPNIWFDNVEIIAAKEIGRETVQYVANIIKYYVAYSFSLQQELRKQQARDSVGITDRRNNL